MSDEIKNPNTEDEEYQPDLMTLEDEDGNEVTFEVIDALDHKGVHYLAVVEYTENEDENAKPKKYVLVNPEIISRSEEMITDIEGCLSLPGLAGMVERHEAVTVKAKNRFGKPLKIEADGWLARIFQHEIDHLDGVLYIDRAEEVFEPTPEEAEKIKD